jgi:hypothetical protein
VLISYDDNFIGNHKERNSAIVTSTQGMDSVGWCGPMTAHCRPHKDGRPNVGDMGPDMGKLIHVDLQAFSHLVSFLIDHENQTFMHAMRKRPKLNCVKVACHLTTLFVCRALVQFSAVKQVFLRSLR